MTAVLTPTRITLLLSAVGILAGCQGGSPATPSAANTPPVTGGADLAAQFAALPSAQQDTLRRVWDAALNGADGRLNMGNYRLSMDFTTGDFQLFSLDRNGNDVIDVTGVLNDPACPNSQCVDFVINARDPQSGRTSLTIYLFNPSTTTVFDTRFIWTNLQDNDLDDAGNFLTDNDVIIGNPDGWTNEFDDFGDILLMAAGTPDYTAFGDILDDTDPAWPVINPFHTMASNETDQSLEGKQVALADVEATVRGDTASVDFIVTTSVGSRRQDPVNFGVVQQVGLMDNNLFGRTEIRAVIRDVQGDIGYTTPTDPDITHMGVELHAPNFYQVDPTEIHQMNFNGPTADYPEGYWSVDLENWQIEGVGKFPMVIRAHSDANPATQVQGWDLYWRGIIQVVNDPSGGGGGGGPTQNAIAYISTEFGDADIFLNNLQGTSKRNLNGVSDPGENSAEDIDPAFSSPYVNPSGTGTKRWIAWASNRGTTGNFRIYIWDINGSGGLHTYPSPIAITPSLNNAVAPSWSFNNDAIVCQVQDNRGRWAIRKFPIQLDPNDALPPIIQPAIQLTRNNTGDNTNPSFNRTGEYVTFDSTRIRFDNAEIYVMDADGENVMLNRITYQTGNDRDPVFSSGTGYDQILYQKEAVDGWNIQVANFTGGNYVPPAAKNQIQIALVVSGDGDDINPAVSPDGRQLLFASNRGNDGAFDLYSINAAEGGGGEIQRTNTGDDEYRPAWGLDVF